MKGNPAAASVPALERAANALASASVARMDETLPWFRTLPADQRSWVALLAHNGVRAFVGWIRSADKAATLDGVGADIFAEAPRELTKSLPLEHTLALIKVTIDVIEERVPHLVPAAAQPDLIGAVLRYSRDVAFAAATVYAKAAETRGAWDTRLQALLVDALLSDDPDTEIASRAAALGWTGAAPIAVAVGTAPRTDNRKSDVDTALDTIARSGRSIGVETLASVHNDRLIVVVAGAQDPVEATAALASAFGAGPIVVGDPVHTLPQATLSARTAAAGARVVAAWPSAPRPVAAQALLPERVLDGDAQARHALIETVYKPLRQGDHALLNTLSSYLEHGTALETTARALFVHPNTVRYRLRRVATLCGVAPTDPRGAFTLRIALAIGALSDGAQ